MAQLGRRDVVTVSVFVALYLATGSMAMVLATPGGYATAVFPPAGLALMAVILYGWRLWPGIWMGSFALNLWVGWTSGRGLSPVSMAVAAGIAVGASLQALVAWRLLREGGVRQLQTASGLLRFLVLGGPLACLVASSLGSLVLRLGGFISTVDLPRTWFTWWCGDSIGVLLMVPLVLILRSDLNPAWGVNRFRLLTPVLVLLSGTGFLVAQLNVREHRRLQEVFELRVRQCLQPLRQDLQRYEGVVNGLASYVESTSELDATAFRRFVKGAYGQAPGFKGLSWCPWVQAGQRRHFEAEHSEALGIPFRFKEMGPEGRFRPAQDREGYFPVALMEPINLNRAALGFDLGSDPVRRTFLDDVVKVGGARSSKVVTLVQSAEGQSAVLLGRAVWSPDGRLRGVVTAVYSLPAITQGLAEEARRSDMAVRLEDRTNVSEGSFLLPWTELPSRRSDSQFAAHETVSWTGRAYEIQFRPTDRFMALLNAQHIWAMLTLGLLLTSLIQISLLILPTVRAEAPVSPASAC